MTNTQTFDNLKAIKGIVVFYMAKTELRKFSRVHYNANVLLHINDEKHIGRLLDISINGALIRTSAHMPMHSKVQLDIIMDKHTPAITMYSQVVHIDEQDVGFQCDEIDIDSMIQLRQIINSYNSDPEVQSDESKSLWELKTK